MTIRRRVYGYGNATVRLVECPACGATLGNMPYVVPNHLLNEHEPSDFGLESLWATEDRHE